MNRPIVHVETHEACILLVTAPSEETAKQIANTLVEHRLAACVSITPIQSVFRWDGKIVHDSEWQLNIKTMKGLLDALGSKLREIHPYEVPECLELDVKSGSSTYLDWLAESTKRELSNKPF